MIIDLSHRLNEDTPTYPGDPKLSIKPAATFADKNNLGHQVTLGTHAGTHIDAPAHMIEQGKTLDSFTADQFVGRGCYILVKNNVFDINDAEQADIQEGDIVVFNTMMSYRFYDSEYFTDYPAMNEEIANYLVDKKVKMVGVDTCSIDNQPSFPIHKILLGSDIPVIENLTNLEQLHGVNAKIYALPIRLNLDGAPARVIAEIS